MADPGDDRVAGMLDPMPIRRAIRDHIPEVTACYSRYLERGTQAGRVVAVFTIGRDGHVVRAEVNGFDRELDRCMCAIVAKLVFSRGSGPVVVNYPFELRPAP